VIRVHGEQTHSRYVLLLVMSYGIALLWLNWISFIALHDSGKVKPFNLDKF